MKAEFKKIFNTIKFLKEKEGLIVTDVHTHPLDVMGVIGIDEYSYLKKKNSIDVVEDDVPSYFKPDILEIFKYGQLVNIVSPLYYKFFPHSVHSIIRKNYVKVNKRRLLSEMIATCIDRSVLMSVEPWSKLDDFARSFSDNKFLFLSSIDIHNINIEDIESNIKKHIDTYKIVGLKLHPNLQNFKPQPKDNDFVIAEKLTTIYSVAEKYNLYLHFHGGRSFFTNSVHSNYQNLHRSSDNAVLKNFCNEQGKSEIFENYQIPIIIAHLGNFGIMKPDYTLLKLLTRRYPNIYFDTAAASPTMLTQVIRVISSNKIVFGTDAIYYRIMYHLYFLYTALRHVNSEETIEEMLLNILGKNFSSNILNN